MNNELDPYHFEMKRIRRSDCLKFEEFDKKYNLDTSHPIELAKDNSGEYRPSFIPNNDKIIDSSGFQNTPLEILDHLNDFFSTYKDIKDYTFIDIGSGKGKVIFYNILTNAPYKNYIGIEADKVFNDIAINNLRNTNIKINKEVSFIEIDALDYDIPNSKCIYYFYYPFYVNIFDAFINKNLLKMSETKSLIVFVYEDDYNFSRYTDKEPIYNKYRTKIYELG